MLDENDPMDPFPEAYELISFFEVEPRIADAGVPWAYNQLDFVTERDGNRLQCVIEPGYESLVFRWSKKGAVILELDVKQVKGLAVEDHAGRETLVASFQERHPLLPLRIQLRPTVSVFWGTSEP
jgi:hypothetical protein